MAKDRMQAATEQVLAAARGLPPRERGKLLDVLLRDPIVIGTPHGPILFINHSRKSSARAQKLWTKEPSSIQWIDSMEPGSVFWDIGANIGVLTLYAASRKDLEIWAFEPAAVNYYNLTANCEINGWSKAVHCLLLGFGDALRLAELNVSQLQSAESFSFKAKKRYNPTDRQTTIIWTIDDFIERFGVACPNYIKIDVPGLASEILLGASHTLSRPEIKQIQIEVQEGDASYEWTSDFLANRGFQFVQRSTERGQFGDVVFGRPKPTMSAH